MNEIGWETIERASGYPTPIREYTTVTQKLRRVARFDWDLARLTVDRNRPTRIAVMGFDYLDYGDFRKTQIEMLGQKSEKFLSRFASEIGQIELLQRSRGGVRILSLLA